MESSLTKSFAIRQRSNRYRSKNVLGSGALASAALLATVIALFPTEAAALKQASSLPNGPLRNPQVTRLLNEAQAELSAGHLSKALTDLKLALGIEPANPIVLARLGVVLNQAGAFAEAKERLSFARSRGAPDEITLAPLLEAMLALRENQAVLDLFPNPAGLDRSFSAATILRARAVALQALGDDADALAAINRALEIRRDFDAVMTAANIAASQRQWTLADSLTNESLKLSPGNTDALIFKSTLAMQVGDKSRALLILDQLVTEKPRSLAARLARIKVNLAVGNTDKARPDVDLILAQTPGLPIAVYYRAVIRARAGNMPAAWSVAHGLPSEFVQAESEFAVNVAIMAAGAGFLETAATILNSAVLKNPNLLDARIELASIRLRQHSPQYALDVLAPVEDSKDLRVSILFAQSYLMAHHPADAQRYATRAIELGGGEGLLVLGKALAFTSLDNWLRHHPDDGLVRRQYAVLLLRSGEFAAAKAQYEQLVRERPSDSLSLNNLAWLVRNDDPRRALALAMKAVKQSPTSADYLDTLGSLQLSQSDPRGALESLQKAHRLKSEDPEITYHLALALNENGARALALATLRTAVAKGAFRDSENAKRLLAAWR